MHDESCCSATRHEYKGSSNDSPCYRFPRYPANFAIIAKSGIARGPRGYAQALENGYARGDQGPQCARKARNGNLSQQESQNRQFQQGVVKPVASAGIFANPLDSKYDADGTDDNKPPEIL